MLFVTLHAKGSGGGVFTFARSAIDTGGVTAAGAGKVDAAKPDTFERSGRGVTSTGRFVFSVSGLVFVEVRFSFAEGAVGAEGGAASGVGAVSTADAIGVAGAMDIGITLKVPSPAR